MNKETITQLKAELADIEAKLAAVPDIEKRRRELRGSWGNIGEIGEAVRSFRDSKFPVLEKGGWRPKRVVAVDDKWIVTREDGAPDAEVTRYRREDGRKERARDARGAIDHVKALEIWSKHACNPTAASD